jgi:hypothetical protein
LKTLMPFMAQEPQAGNGGISRKGFHDPVQTNVMLVGESNGSLVQLMEGSGRASGLTDLRQVRPGWATTNHLDCP